VLKFDFFIILLRVVDDKMCLNNFPKTRMCGDKECKFHSELVWEQFLDDSSYLWDGENIISPEKVSKFSTHRYWFVHTICNHQLAMTVAEVLEGGVCDYCNNDKVCGKKGCLMCDKWCYAEITDYYDWAPTNVKSPGQVSIKSQDQYDHVCRNCSHVFKMSPSEFWAGMQCPYCAENKLCNKYHCQICTSKSLAAPECYVGYRLIWSGKNKKNLRSVFRGSLEKFWFECIRCRNEFYIGLKEVQNIEKKFVHNCKYCGLVPMSDEEHIQNFVWLGRAGRAKM
jgi:hypothetical protein